MIIEVILVALLFGVSGCGMVPVDALGHAAPMYEVRTVSDMEQDRLETFQNVGKDNGFTWNKWVDYYQKMDGFSGAMGYRIRPSLPPQ